MAFTKAPKGAAAPFKGKPMKPPAKSGPPSAAMRSSPPPATPAGSAQLFKKGGKVKKKGK